MKRFSGLFLLILLTGSLSKAQDVNSLGFLSEASASDSTLLTSQDSLDVFLMIDSLLSLPEVGAYSQLAVRLGYNSNITASGRPLDMGKFGLSSGLSYYHKSGMFADVSGYWSEEYDPDYFLTTTSLGYMNTSLKRWSFLFEYSHYFYNLADENAYVAYTDNINLSSFLEFKPINFRFDYSIYFGDKVGHRFQPGVFAGFEKKNWHKISRIYFYPSINVLFGTEQLTSYVLSTDNPILMRIRLRQGLLYSEVNSTAFGVMNYSFSAPLSVTLGNWNFLLNYTYNIPRLLPGEIQGLESGGFLSFSVTKYFNF